MTTSLDCPAATRLLSDALDRGLAQSERARLSEHLGICPACTECRRQFDLLRTLVRGWRERSVLDSH
jgi:predicted anti-sigma-YlaC factor YlaD